MIDVFAQQCLSRLSIVAALVFAYCAWMVYSLNREAKPNRIAVVFNVLFAAWAAAASFWYGAYDPSEALALYRAFSWTWSLFPPLILHFSLSVTGNPVLDGRFRRPFLLAQLRGAAAPPEFLEPRAPGFEDIGQTGGLDPEAARGVVNRAQPSFQAGQPLRIHLHALEVSPQLVGRLPRMGERGVHIPPDVGERRVQFGCCGEPGGGARQQ